MTVASDRGRIPRWAASPRAAAPAGADQYLSRARLAQVLRYDIAANLAGLALLLGIYAAITRRLDILLLTGLVASHLILDLWYEPDGTMREFDRDEVEAALAAGQLTREQLTRLEEAAHRVAATEGRQTP